MKITGPWLGFRLCKITPIEYAVDLNNFGLKFRKLNHHLTGFGSYITRPPGSKFLHFTIAHPLSLPLFSSYPMYLV
jgi:hypothetical protein